MCLGFRTLTNALGKAENIRVEEFIVGYGSLFSGVLESLHPVNAADLSRLRTCQHAFAGLKVLKVCLSFDRNRIGVDPNRVELEYFDKETNIVRWLLLMPSLEELHLGFEVDPRVPSVFQRIADACHFPNLTICTIANARFRCSDLQRFLEQHKSSLRSLCVLNCPVLDGTWISFLYWLRDSLKLSHLRVVRLSLGAERQIWFLARNVQSDEVRNLRIIAGNDDDDTPWTLCVTRHSRFGVSVVYEAISTADGFMLSIEETGERLFHGIQLTGDVKTRIAELLWDGVYIRHL